MSLRRFFLMGAATFLAAVAYRVGLIQADEWLPISPDELKMTSDAGAPGAPAIILYRQVDRDDSNARIPHDKGTHNIHMEAQSIPAFLGAATSRRDQNQRIAGNQGGQEVSCGIRRALS